MTWKVKEVLNPHTHDCENCVFVGWYKNANVYFCPRLAGNDLGSVIIRESSEPSNYWSLSVWRGTKPRKIAVMEKV